MSLRSIGTLARQRRTTATGQGAAAAATDGSVTSLEAAVPTEIVALYTAIIAGCQSALHDYPHATFFVFRLIIYLIALACTIFIAIRNVTPAIADRAQGHSPAVQAARSPEVMTAILAFASWGLVLPGSFLYVWLSAPVLPITVITITAAAGFLLAIVFAPQLRSKEQNTARPVLTLTDIPPAGS